MSTPLRSSTGSSIGSGLSPLDWADWLLLVDSLQIPPPLAVAQQERGTGVGRPLTFQQHLHTGGAAPGAVRIPPSFIDRPRSGPPVQPVVAAACGQPWPAGREQPPVGHPN